MSKKDGPTTQQEKKIQNIQQIQNLDQKETKQKMAKAKYDQVFQGVIKPNNKNIPIQEYDQAI